MRETAGKSSKVGKNKEKDEAADNIQKATDKDKQENSEVAQDKTANSQPSQDDKTEGKGSEELGKSAENQTKRKNEQPQTKSKNDNESKATEADDVEEAGNEGGAAKPKEESLHMGQKPKPEPSDQALKLDSGKKDTGIVRVVAFLKVKPVKMAGKYDIILKASSYKRANFCMP
ncbi:hypothetical protein HPB51_021502 [Rhipicephalus microplus]|uniref:Uncharacterized protein n=1 Tax=Rhipicephalus microplus TaxID=6941 RepID=A0A9J6DJ02_RHIMP|nr:hypothetical protein HPB51_021502 [Rhipicephalus microplus]